MEVCLRTGIKFGGRGILTALLCLCISLYSVEVRADGNMQCSRTGTGDVQCPSGTSPYSATGTPSTNPIQAITGSNILGSGAIDLSAITGGSGGSSILGQITGLFDKLIPILKNSFLGELLKEITNLPVVKDLIAAFTQVQDQITGLSGGTCGGGSSSSSGGSTTIGGALMNFAQNMVMQKINSGGLGSLGNIKNKVCSAVSTATGTGGPTGPIDTLSKGGKKIAECAQKSIGNSTADVASTQGGALGCALAVSRMLDCAGYGVGTHVSTVALYNALEKDPCYEKVDTGHITSSDAMNLQPGDVFVTKRGSRAGHTGIYEGNGNVISNSSSGFAGAAKGTIQRNYTVTKWSSVTNRNPGGSAVFRRICE